MGGWLNDRKVQVYIYTYAFTCKYAQEHCMDLAKVWVSSVDG